MPDELLRALGRQQREDDATAEAPGGSEHSTAIEGNERDALLDQVFAEVDHAASPSSQSVAPEAKVVEIPWWRSRGVVAAAVAIAAALLVWVLVRPTGTELPGFAAVSIAGGDVQVRSEDEPTGPLSLRSNEDRIDWTFAPSEPVGRPVEVGLFARSSDGRQVYARATGAEVSSSGLVRLQGSLQSHIELAPGQWTVDVIFAGAGDLPADASAASATGAWQSVRVRVTIAAP